MTKTAPAWPVVQQSESAWLPDGPAAAGAARRCVLAAIESWGVPADSYVAALLTSELVTNAIRYAGSPVRLCVMYSCGQLRVYVHDSSRAWPAALEAATDAEKGRGLMLVDSMATDWGCYGTSGGKVVYFALSGEPGEK